MIKVEIVSDSRYPLSRKTVRSAVFDTLSKNKVTSGDIEVSVAVVGRRKMRILSNKYLEDNCDHEVLSFPFEDLNNASRGFINPPDGILRLGDIVLCWPEVVIAASRDEVLVDEETSFLVGHGVLHLLGKHHE